MDVCALNLKFATSTTFTKLPDSLILQCLFSQPELKRCLLVTLVQIRCCLDIFQQLPSDS